MLSSKGQLTFGEDSEEIRTLGGRAKHITLRVQMRCGRELGFSAVNPYRKADVYSPPVPCSRV